MKGRLITFEGGDGAGKTTLMESLYEYLIKQGKIAVKTRAPGGTDLGKKIRSLLLDGKEPVDKRAELFLFMADRAQHVQEVILPALHEGKTVLCDRFNDSTVAYQGAARDLDPTRVRELCDFATGGLQPDLTFYLDIDPALGLQRSIKKSGAPDRLESEALAFHEKLRAAFHEIAKKEPSRVCVLDGSLSKEALLEQALRILHDIL